MDDQALARPELDEWLTPSETGAIVKLSVQTLANHRNRGVGIRFTKLTPGRSGRIRYRRRDVEAWLSARESGQQAEA